MVPYNDDTRLMGDVMTDEQYEKLMDEVTLARRSIGFIRVVVSLWLMAWVAWAFLSLVG